MEDSDSSLDSSVNDAGLGHINVEEETRNLTICEKSDGTTEMAVTSEYFRRSSAKGATVSASVQNAPKMASEGIESSGFTSQDATLFEMKKNRPK